MNKKNSKLHACPIGSGQGKAKIKSDKMSKMLAAYAVILDPSVAQKEFALRRELIAGFELYSDSRIELGRRLFNYRSFYKPHRIWTSVTKLLGEAIGRDSRTILRLVEEYEHSIGIVKIRKIAPPNAEDESFGDEAFKLAESHVSYLEARQLVRQAVAWCTSRDQIISVLKQIISEEAEATWRIYKPFTMEIVPCSAIITLSAEYEPLDKAA